MKIKSRFIWNKRRKIKYVLFFAYCFFIIYYAVLSRAAGDEHTSDLRLMWAYREMLTGHPEWKEDVGYNLMNILFFIPFGFLFPEKNILLTVFENRRWLLILCAGMLLSIFVELTQYIFCLGLCELDDVICNGLGAMVGHGIFRCFILCLLSFMRNTKELDD